MTNEEKVDQMQSWLHRHAPTYLQLASDYVGAEDQFIQLICDDLKYDTGIIVSRERMSGVLAAICFTLYIMKSPIEEIP